MLFVLFLDNTDIDYQTDTPLTHCLPTALASVNHNGAIQWAKSLVEQALAGSVDGTITRREVEDKLRRALGALGQLQERLG